MQKKIFFFASLFLSPFTSSMTMILADLKGTYDIFNQGNEHLSPLHGALLWESGVIKNYYDASATLEVQPGTWLPRSDGPIRLARALFTDTLGNFDVSRNTNYPARHLGISTIASIIALLERCRHELTPIDAHVLEDFILRDPEFMQSVMLVNNKYEEKKESYDKLIKQAVLLGQIEQIAQLKYSSSRALAKLYTNRLCRDWLRKERIVLMESRVAEIGLLQGQEKIKAQKELYQKQRELLALKQAKIGGDYNRVYELAQALIDAHKISQYYPCHSVYGILLAALYRKAKNKQDLISFITLLIEKIGPHLCKPMDKILDLTQYTASDYDAIKGRVSSWPSSAMLDVIGPKTYEALACAQITERYYKGPFPKVTEYANVLVNEVAFPDCVEITLFNFCNMVLYDRAIGVFDIAHSPNAHPSEALINFYTNPVNKHAANIGLLAVHQSWDILLQNLPLVTYRTLILNNSGQGKVVLEAPKDTNGFIYGLPETVLSQLKHDGQRVYIAGRWYIHITDPSAYLCEMHPTIRNVVLVLDRLFNLNLFEAIPIEQAFLSEKFNAYYFPRLCEYFNLLQGVRWTDAMLTSLDSDDYTDKGTLLSFTYFDLLLTDEHAEIIVKIKGENIADLGPQLVRFASKNYSLGQLLTIFPFEVEQLPQENPYPYLFYLPLQNNQVKISTILFCVQQLLNQQLSGQDYKYYTERIISLIRQLPERLDWHYHEALMLNIDKRAFGFECVCREFERILSIAKSRLVGSVADCEYVPSLYLALIAQGQKREDVMIVIDNLIARPEPFDRKPLLNLLIAMVKNGQAIAQARKAVEQCINSTVTAERLLAATLHDILPKQL